MPSRPRPAQAAAGRGRGPAGRGSSGQVSLFVHQSRRQSAQPGEQTCRRLARAQAAPRRLPRRAGILLAASCPSRAIRLDELSLPVLRECSGACGPTVPHAQSAPLTRSGPPSAEPARSLGAWGLEADARARARQCRSALGLEAGACVHLPGVPSCGALFARVLRQGPQLQPAGQGPSDHGQCARGVRVPAGRLLASSTARSAVAEHSGASKAVAPAPTRSNDDLR